MGRRKIRGTVCTIDGCSLPQLQRDWCAKHYMRWYRHGDPLHTGTPTRGMSLVERFWAKVDQSGGAEACWPWMGGRHKFGYGNVEHDVRAHRLAWELANGPIPAGLHVLHRCDNPPCCNARHLFIGTDADNVADMRAKGRQGRPVMPKGDAWRAIHPPRPLRTHCGRGHEYTDATTVFDRNGKRRCRECDRIRDAKRISGWARARAKA